jgi:putative transposase
VLLLTEGQMSDHKGAILMRPHLPHTKELPGDKGYDSRLFHEALIARRIISCIPSTRSRKIPIPYDKVLYRQRHRVENTFGRIKDLPRVAMRHNRYVHAVFSALCLAAIVLFWIDEP